MNVVRDPPPPRSRLRWRWLALAVVGFAAILAVSGTITGIAQFWDVGSPSWFARLQGEGEEYQRGAAFVARDVFGDSLNEVKYLKQNWRPADSLWFYNTTQGSDLLPYDFFMVLERRNSQDLFRSNENMNAYRYLPQKPTFSNPDALPVGFVKDTYQDKAYVGLTCAACHTGQVNYNKVGYRIDGGPSGADMKLFVEQLGDALRATSQDTAVRARFVKNVRALGTYRDDKTIVDDLGRYTQRISMYAIVNDSDTPYGFFRLDAFGRIYNRVLEHLLNGSTFARVLSEMVTDGQITQAQMEAICLCKDEALPNVLSDDERDHLVARVAASLSDDEQHKLRDRLFNRANAPVSYPFLWDTPHHDYVQWNGLAANAALGPVGRNSGEAIGVFGTLDWSQGRFFSLSSIVSGQGFKARHISFKSSVNVRNLSRIERHLTSLESPKWPDAFPPLDNDRIKRGRVLFAGYCGSCHAEIVRDDPARRIVAHLSRLEDIGTDRAMANNGVNYSGFSGIIRNQYVNAGPGDLLIDQQAPVAALLTKATLSVVATPDPDKNLLARGFDWLYDIAGSLFYNEIKPSLKNGNYDPDTTDDPYASLRAYKGRALNGIWATAPYLHNGSVPTLYHLLLPRKQEGDPDEGEYRPKEFVVGSREFLPGEVGLKYRDYNGFIFNTELPGNSNTGHEYGTRALTAENGEPRPALTREQRLDLIEYLKSL
jgi:hypothetical protein